MTTPFAKVTHVILDLDGTLINTEQLVDEVVSAVLHKRGDFTASRVRKAMEHVRGMRPGDGTRAVMDLLEITDVSVDALLAETTGGDARADRFLAIVLGLEDYGQFCGLMQAHAASLAVAAEMESVALS